MKTLKSKLLTAALILALGLPFVNLLLGLVGQLRTLAQ